MGILSLFSLVLGYLLTWLLHVHGGLDVELAYTYSILTCSVINFLGCRYYVFRGTRGAFLIEALKFFPSILVFRMVEVAMFSILNRVLRNYHAAYIVTAVASTLLKLLLSRAFIFQRKR